MKTNNRLAPPPNDDAFTIRQLQVSFAIPVWITFDDQDRMRELVDTIVNRPCNQLADGVHWASGFGSMPQWSQADALFLGRTPDPNAPVSGEPTYDDSVYSIETTSRGFLDDDERRKVEKRRSRPSSFAKPPIICLCGSTRFVETFNEWRQKLTLEGFIVLGIEIVTTQSREQDPQHTDPETKKRLDILHLRKIDLADEVMILNVGGYVGESTQKEIDYAKRRRKTLRWLEPVNAA